MQRSTITGVFLKATLALLACASAASAVIPLTKPPVPQRVALADCIVIGKVKTLETELVNAAPPLKIPGVGKIPYQMAVVTVKSALLEAKEQTEIRVGYVPPPNKGGAARFRRYAQVELSVDQEGCFFLQKHPDESFYMVLASYCVMDKSREKEFESELSLVKRCAKLLQAPDEGLKAKDLEDRRLTVALLLFRYRTPRFVYTAKPATEPIEASQSKLILATLLECDWSDTASPSPMAGLNLFLRLGLTEQDGWTPPESPMEYAAAAQKWLGKHGGKYRIQRYVPEEKPAKGGA